MNENNGYAAYALWNSLKLHFNTNYDYHKYNGKTNVSKQTFANRKDKYSFYKISRKYSIEEMRDYFVANIVHKDVQWVGEISGSEGEEVYKKWQKRNQRLTYTFENDIVHLLDKYDPVDWLKVTNHYPKLLSELMEGNICIETVVILNDLLNFMSMWENKISDDIIWPEYQKKIKKYTPFVLYQKEKCKSLLREKIKDAKTKD